MQEDVKIVVAKYPSKLTEKTSETITKKITWKNGEEPDTELVDETINIINSSVKTHALGTNLSIDTTDALTKEAILKNIGLTDEQKAITTLSGTLQSNKGKSITFNVVKGTYNDSIDKDVYYYQDILKDTKDSYNSIIKYNGTYYVIASKDAKAIYTLDDSFKLKDKVSDANVSGNSFYIFNNQLYIATDEGLYKLNNSTNKIEQVDTSFTNNIYSLYNYDNELYLATIDGVKKLNFDNKIVAVIIQARGIYSLIKYKNNLYAGTSFGLSKVDFTSKKLIDIGSHYYTRDLVVYNNKLYLGNYYGLYTLNDKGNDIDKVDDSIGNIYSLTIYNNYLYTAAERGEGLYELNKDGTKLSLVLSRPSEESSISLFDNTLMLHKTCYLPDETEGITFYFSNN